MTGDTSPPTRDPSLGMPPSPWPILPPPDLADTYQQLPQSWKTGAVLLADRILAAAYRADVLGVVEQIRRDVESGAVRGMTIADYLEELTEAHPRVLDFTKALQCVAYSPQGWSIAGPVQPGWNVTGMAIRCFRADVEAELEARGILEEEGPPSDGDRIHPRAPDGSPVNDGDIELPDNPF